MSKGGASYRHAPTIALMQRACTYYTRTRSQALKCRVRQSKLYMTREMQKELEEKYFRECGDRAVAEEMAQMDYDADQASSDYYPHYDECSAEYWF